MSVVENIRKWFWNGVDPLLDELSGHDEKMGVELGELKKLVRRQGIQQESLVREISAKLDTLAAAGEKEKENGRPDSQMELAESFFHLEAALAFQEIGSETLKSLDIVWEKLEHLCNETGLEIVRASGVPFDSRMHEALDRAPPGDSPFVKSLTAPGFIHNGRVIRPARVLLSEKNNMPITLESEEI